MKVISFINEKGGTGKTTSAREIAGILKKKNKILLIDCDYQSNLSSSLLKNDTDKTIVNVILGENINNCIVNIEKNVDLISGTISSRDIESKLSYAREKEFILKKAIEKLKEKYDYILIDCRPDMRLLEKNALASSDLVITPIEPHNYSLDGFDILDHFLKAVKPILKNDLKHVGYFSRVAIGNAPKEIISNSNEDYSNILDSYIRHNIKLQECSIQSRFIIDYAPKSIGSLDFKKLVKEMQVKKYI